MCYSSGMKIVVVAPFFPPDVESPAPYVKTLVAKLAAQHEVTVVLYGHLPERVPGVRFVCTDKRRPLVPRLSAYTRALLATMRNADVVYAENGPSVELPILIASFLTRTPYVLHEGDLRARKVAHSSFGLRHVLTRLVIRRAAKLVESLPHERPELLPFAPEPTEVLAAYHTSWDTHLHDVITTLEYVVH
jgi:hypothetical protein